MKANSATCGQLRHLLRELGFQHRIVDERFESYTETSTDMFFVLPRWPDEKIVRESDLASLRLQLDYRGLMEKADFDAALAGGVQAKS